MLCTVIGTCLPSPAPPAFPCFKFQFGEAAAVNDSMCAFGRLCSLNAESAVRKPSANRKTARAKEGQQLNKDQHRQYYRVLVQQERAEKAHPILTSPVPIIYLTCLLAGGYRLRTWCTCPSNSPGTKHVDTTSSEQSAILLFPHLLSFHSTCAAVVLQLFRRYFACGYKVGAAKVPWRER